MTIERKLKFKHRRTKKIKVEGRKNTWEKKRRRMIRKARNECGGENFPHSCPSYLGR